MEIILLSQRGCTECEHSKKQLKQLQFEYDFTLQEKDASLAEKYDVYRFPTMVFMDNSIEIDRLTGLKPLSMIKRILTR